MVDAYLSNAYLSCSPHVSPSSLSVIKDYWKWRQEILRKEQRRLKNAGVKDPKPRSSLHGYHSKTMWYVKKLADTLPGK